MAGEDEKLWLFEYICGVLDSPTWEVPVMSFIDEKCIVFDNEEENKLCYSALHQEFKELVERVLTQHLMEIGVAPEDFFAACEAAYQQNTGDFASQVIEQILACDDFLTFKSIMFERNKELEYEALQALSAQGVGGDVEDGGVESEESKQESKLDCDNEEKDNLEIAIELSKQEDAAARLIALEKEQAEIEKAIALSLLLAEEKEKQEQEALDTESKVMEPLDSKANIHLESKLEEKQEPRATFKKMTHVQRARSSRAILGGNPLPPINSSVKISRQRSVVEKYIDEGLPAGNTNTDEKPLASSEIDKVELARRTRHLQAQREKLLAKKKAERMSRLQRFEQGKPKQASHAPIRQASRSEVESKKPEVARSGQGQLSRALAQKMKRELLNEEPFYSYGFINDDSGGDEYAALDARLRALDNVRTQQQELLKHEL